MNDLPTTYLFQEFFEMLLEYMHRRSQIDKKEFDNIIEQNSEEMGAKIFKTTLEIERARGEARGKEIANRKTAFNLMQTTPLTDAQIAKAIDTDEAFVKAIRQEFLGVQQQG